MQYYVGVFVFIWKIIIISFFLIFVGLIKYILVAVILLCSAYAIAIFDPFEMILQDVREQ